MPPRNLSISQRITFAGLTKLDRWPAWPWPRLSTGRIWFRGAQTALRAWRPALFPMTGVLPEDARTSSSAAGAQATGIMA